MNIIKRDPTLISKELMTLRGRFGIFFLSARLPEEMEDPSSYSSCDSNLLEFVEKYSMINLVLCFGEVQIDTIRVVFIFKSF